MYSSYNEQKHHTLKILYKFVIKDLSRFDVCPIIWFLSIIATGTIQKLSMPNTMIQTTQPDIVPGTLDLIWRNTSNENSI